MIAPTQAPFDRELKGVTGSKPKCPFYGFFEVTDYFMGQVEGNNCALEEGCGKPCGMKMDSNTPNWNECYIYNHAKNTENLKKIVANTNICAEEFRPKGKKKWKGIPLQRWFKHVMGYDFLKPA